VVAIAVSPSVVWLGHGAGYSCLMLGLEVHGIVPLLPHMSSWCGDYLHIGYVLMVWYFVEPRDKLTFTLHNLCN